MNWDYNSLHRNWKLMNCIYVSLTKQNRHARATRKYFSSGSNSRFEGDDDIFLLSSHAVSVYELNALFTLSTIRLGYIKFGKSLPTRSISLGSATFQSRHIITLFISRNSSGSSYNIHVDIYIRSELFRWFDYSSLPVARVLRYACFKCSKSFISLWIFDGISWNVRGSGTYQNNQIRCDSSELLNKARNCGFDEFIFKSYEGNVCSTLQYLMVFHCFSALFFRKVLRAYQDSWDNRCRILFCCIGKSDRNRVSIIHSCYLISLSSIENSLPILQTYI